MCFSCTCAAALLISNSGTVACLVMQKPRRVHNRDLPPGYFFGLLRGKVGGTEGKLRGRHQNYKAKVAVPPVPLAPVLMKASFPVFNGHNEGVRPA